MIHAHFTHWKISGLPHS
jgi:hypothetical protein